MKRYTVFYIFSILLSIVTLTSCDGFNNAFHKPVNNGLWVADMQFHDTYQRINLKVDLDGFLNSPRLDDSTRVKILIEDGYTHIVPTIRVGQPTLSSIKFVAPKEMQNTGLALLTLVDLSQPADVIRKQHDYIRRLSTVFHHNNLYLSFMLPGGDVTNIMPASDYIIDNYISINAPILTEGHTDALDLAMTDPTTIMSDSLPVIKPRHAYLYRSVAQMLGAIENSSGTPFDIAKYKALLVFSDGQVYDETDNLPIDPQHFQLQELLIRQAHNIPLNTAVYYVRLTSSKTHTDIADNNIMRMLTMQSHGTTYTSIPGRTFFNDLLKRFRLSIHAYEVTLANPIGKLYYGCSRYISLRFVTRKGNKTIAECYRDYDLGTVYHTVFCGRVSYYGTMAKGIIVAILFMAFVYVLLQFVIPYVNYRIFRNKYVVKYTGPNMSLRGNLVAPTCYYCKAPFRIGDSIVARCQHTMHLECWDENGQHCPEYGNHCPDGSHFYDRVNLFNPHNGSFYIKWMIVAILASTLAWINFIFFDHDQFYDLLYSISDFFDDGVDPNIANLASTGIMKISPRMYRLPLVGVRLAPILTLFMAYFSTYHRKWNIRLVDILWRCFVVNILTFIFFLLEFAFVFVCDMYDAFYLLDWIPWTLTSYVIIFFSTYHTRIHVPQRIALIASLTLGIVGALIWSIFGILEISEDFDLLCFGYIIYSVGIAAIIARKLQNSEHYFLRVSGGIKDMDIALYKWLRQSPDAVVTIGRSVDCSLQLVWDSKEDIAPVHASVRLRYGRPYLTALDGITFVDGRQIPQKKEVRLYHGINFEIGSTKFTYVEA